MNITYNKIFPFLLPRNSAYKQNLRGGGDTRTFADAVFLPGNSSVN